MSVSKTLILRELQSQSGQNAKEIAAKLRITAKHASKMLTQLRGAGEVDWVRQNNMVRWYLTAEAKAIQKEAREDRRVQKLCYLLDWRARQKATKEAESSIGRVANSVFSLGSM